MAGVFQDAGLTDEAATLADTSTLPLDQLTMHLYSNNHTPTPADVIGAYTEAAFGGYAAVALSSPWTPGAIVGNAIPIVAAAAVFTQSSGPNDTVYGYYLTDAANNLFAAELLSGGPFAFSGAGTSLTVTVTETLTRT